MEKPHDVDISTYVWNTLNNLKTTSRLGHF